MAVGAEIANDDYRIVRQHELLWPVFVSAVNEGGEDGVAITAKHILDDFGADSSVRLVVSSGSSHSVVFFGYTLIYCKLRAKPERSWLGVTGGIF